MKRIASVLILLISALPLFAQPEIGLQLYSLRNQFAKDVPGTMQKVRKMGFKYIEMGNTYGLPVSEFKNLLSQNGLTVISVGGDFNKLAQSPDSIGIFAKQFNAKYITCTWIPHKDSFTIADAKNAVDVFNRAGKVLKNYGLELVYHPHGYEFAPHEQGTVFDYMANNMDPQYANFEMDVFWVKHPGQDPVKLMEKYPGRFPLMHLKDRKPGTPGNRKGYADVESNVVLGKGDVGMDAVMKAAKKQGVKYAFIEDESSRVEEQMVGHMEFLKKHLK